MAVKNSIYAIPMLTVNSNAFNNTFQIINPGLPHTCSMLRIMNKSNQDIIISYDGATNHDYVQANTTLEIDAQLNSQPNNFACGFAKGMPIYVKGAAAGVGLIYLAGYYQPILN